jgi:hypothetical protein
MTQQPAFDFTEHEWARFLQHTKWDGDCLLFNTSITKGGYGLFFYRGRTYTSHSLMLRNLLGRDLDAGMDAAHSCRHRNCVNPEHLTEKSRIDNLQDRLRDGTWGWKYSREVIDTIRSSKLPTKQLKEQFGVSESMIQHIRAGRRWKITLPPAGTDTHDSA